MTGERELPEGEGEEIGDEEVRSGWGPGVKKPTWRTMGSGTVRDPRRGSIAERELGL